MQLEPGSTIPEFTATDQNGKTQTRDSFNGRKFVIYFYPKAFTPGCTTESCDFRDRHEFLSAQGYDIVGVSPDKPEYLEKFRLQYDLPFDLLSDPDHEMATSFGAYGLKKNYGREYMGIIRSTLIIDDQGIVEHAFYNVKAKGHAERITNTVAG
jgi:peroxiredoxin Q/BCP